MSTPLILHGPPRLEPVDGSSLSNLTLPKPDVVSALEATWRDETRYKTMASGKRKKPGIKRYRGYFNFGYRGLDTESLGLAAQIIGEDEFYFVPRTILTGVDDAGEIEWKYLCRCRSPLTLHRRLTQDVHPITFEFETVDLYLGAGFAPPLSVIADWCPSVIYTTRYWSSITFESGGPLIYMGTAAGWVYIESHTGTNGQLTVYLDDEAVLVVPDFESSGGEAWFYYDPGAGPFEIYMTYDFSGNPLSPEHYVKLWCPGEGPPPPS